MFIERPPLFYRMLFPETIWRLPCKEKTIYLTFDDGPVPEITPWVLNLLDYYNVKATFFCVGENVARNTELYAEILKRGHHTGNHTMNHIQGTKYSVKDYIRNVDAANELIHSALFRPPHGHMCFGQAHELRQKYKIIMWDVVTRDYSKKLNGESDTTHTTHARYIGVIGTVKTISIPIRKPYFIIGLFVFYKSLKSYPCSLSHSIDLGSAWRRFFSPFNESWKTMIEPLRVYFFTLLKTLSPFNFLL